MAKFYRVTLSSEEQLHLRGLLESRDSKSQIVRRSYILLASDENGDKKWPDAKICEIYGSSLRTIERLRKRFVEEGLEVALKGKPREVFKEKLFDGRVESQLIGLRCQEAPSGYSGWSLRLLADKMVELEYVESISHETVRQILKKTKLSPGGSRVG